MQLLVTTSKSLLVLDSMSGEANVVKGAGDLSFGWIALAPEVFYVGVRQATLTDEPGAPPSEGWIHVYDYALQQVGTLRAPFPLRDMHQLHYHDGNLYVICTADNFVATYDGATWAKWYPLPQHQDLDFNHFNTIYIAGQRLHLMAHNNDREPSRVYVFDFATRELVETIGLGQQAHNIWVDRGEYHACNSGHGMITSERTWQVQRTGGFPRGIAVTPRHIFVGISEFAPRQERDNTTGQLAVFDRRWRPLHRIILEDEGGVFEVRAPGVSDLCLPHGRSRRMVAGRDLRVRQFRVVTERPSEPMKRFGRGWAGRIGRLFNPVRVGEQICE